jgi:hypothetical protein
MLGVAIVIMVLLIVALAALAVVRRFSELSGRGGGRSPRK